MRKIIIYGIIIFGFSIGIGFYYASLWKINHPNVSFENKSNTENVVQTLSEEEKISSEDYYKDLYGYFASENHLVEKHEKQNELYGFGPGYVGENYNFINDQGEVILYSITGNLDD